MQNYLNLLKEVVAKGSRQANRTGVDAISIPGAMLRFDPWWWDKFVLIPDNAWGFSHEHDAP